jgi:hypothetical protein
MKGHRGSRKLAIRITNLEDGMPTVHEAVSRLNNELNAARREGYTIIKLIHGYGSSGIGGDIRAAVQRRLTELVQQGQIRDCVFGEDWSKSDAQTWKLLQARPELKQDQDLGRKNLGITIVML